MDTQVPRVKFCPVLWSGKGDVALGMEVEAEVVDFGLALHPHVEGTAAAPVLSTDGSTTISDPVTGYQITFALTREGALSRLNDLVARYGGRMGFERAIAAGRKRVALARDQAAAVLPSPMADVHAVICPPETQP
ncbi:hypothetical protein dqs_0593 [Azoarcus olearius]|uniref:hypothetical protein n=1 Tax=Azoarcus sp. (strain BH72) TaxID=418699 RepID=UPI0008062F45|nr:hypothetical protein [Azoarcus olearius]ANQ83669.1 hypothetical protein dqs_0593 [Azoarcus olearius]